MKHRKWYPSWMIVMLVVFLAGCGKQEVSRKESPDAYIKKIMDIHASGDSPVAWLDESKGDGTGQMVFDKLTVAMTFPDGWKVSDRRDEYAGYQEINAYEFTKSLSLDADEIDKESVEISIDGKIGNSMDAKGASKKLEDYIKEEITYETSDIYKPTHQSVWQNPAYETVTINGQKYIKASGVTKTKKDAGDAHIGYFAIVNGVILQFVFDTEAATIDQATQSTFDSIMNTITYTY